MKRQAMLIEREDGRREHSPEVEIIDLGQGEFRINPIIPFSVIRENTTKRTPDA